MVVLKRLMAVAVLVGSMALAAVGASADTSTCGSTSQGACNVNVTVHTSTFANVKGINGTDSWSFNLAGAEDGTTYTYSAVPPIPSDYGFNIKSNNPALKIDFTGGTLTFTDADGTTTHTFCPAYTFTFGTSYQYAPTTGCQNAGLYPPGFSPASGGVAIGEGTGGLATVNLTGFAVEVANPNDLPTTGVPEGQLVVTISDGTP